MPLPTEYQEFIYLRTYARWLNEEGRRENWEETVNRYADYMADKLPKDIFYEAQEEFTKATLLIDSLDVMPSMRALWTAGEALDVDNIAGYNCAYTVIDSIKSFAEILYILMNGAGVGYSVERQYICGLPEVPKDLSYCESDIIVFKDSKLGWAKGFYQYLRGLYDGFVLPYDLSKIRPKGKLLKTFGGRASGPEPLDSLLKFTEQVFLKAKGRKLNSLECYDIVCKIAECVVVGGVRRSATINLSNLSDNRLRHAKDGEFWNTTPWRALSNNSVAYTEKPEPDRFMEEWIALMRNGNGERGIVNREGLKNCADKIGRDSTWDFGVNPCGEIALRPHQFCNLTEVVVRPEDTLETLKEKVEAATILGCIQSTLTNFKFLDESWKENCEEERLLGVSLTGCCDHEILKDVNDTAKAILTILRHVATTTAAKWSFILNINKPTAITCVKPSGTVSQLVDSASGIHPRFSKFYIRRVRISATDPLCTFLMDEGIPCEPEVGQTWENASTVIFSFPIAAPKDSVTVTQRCALEQLEYWKMFKEFWCDHNPSITIYVKEDEWLEVGAWVYKNWDYIGGLSFLPAAGGSYLLAPYEEITETSYKSLVRPSVNWDKLKEYEHNDNTEGAKEFACVGGQCEL